MGINKNFDPRYWIRRYRLGSFDRKYGTDTLFFFKKNESAKVSSINKDNKGYTSIKNVEVLKDAFQNSPVKLNNLIFLDIGCGKGRPLMEALLMPFKEVIGIEIDPKIAEIAKSNLYKFKKKLNIHTPTKIITSDFAVSDLPKGNLFIFLNQPFGELSTKLLLDKIVKHKGKATICYCKPTFGYIFDESLEKVKYDDKKEIHGANHINFWIKAKPKKIDW